MHFLRSSRIFVAALVLLLPAAASARRQDKTGNETGNGATDPAADLAERVQADKVVLHFDEAHGYLRSVLKELNVPVSSQALVFSKSSFQLSQISPETPRAIYFNDDTYVGWVNHGQFIEIATVDPKLGPVFYTVDQEYDPFPVIKKETENCTICHDTFQTSTPFPRLLILSVLP